jgi:hypothetical protein
MWQFHLPDHPEFSAISSCKPLLGRPSRGVVATVVAN